MEKRVTPESTKKEIQKYYNYEIKEYLARDYSQRLNQNHRESNRHQENLRDRF